MFPSISIGRSMRGIDNQSSPRNQDGNQLFAYGIIIQDYYYFGTNARS